MVMENLTFSIITICLNAEKSIERTIQSVLSQTYPHIEYIIVDGKSTDHTVGIIQNYRDRIAHFSSEKDEGIYDAMNKGVGRATGNFILFLNADDRLFHEESIASVADYMSQYLSSPIAVFHGNVLIYDEQKKSAHIWKCGPVTRYSLYRRPIPHPATFYRKEAFRRNGLFDVSYRIAGDYEWLVRALIKNHFLFQYMDILVSVFYKGGTSTNKKNKELNEMEKRRVIASYYSKPEDVFLSVRKRIRKTFGFF